LGSADPRDVEVLAQLIGHRFSDPELLRLSMAHRSWVSEHPGEVSNERLEFLGDAVLGWVVADLVFERFPELDEGALTDLRKSVVNASALAQVAAELGLGPHLLLGKGEDAAGGRAKQSILSDAFEAVLGAIYVDAGPQPAYEFVERLIGPRLLFAVIASEQVDHKSNLQELAARAGKGAPRYELTSQGPDHQKRFFARVVVEEEFLGEGEGRSKKEAEQEAARHAAMAISALLGESAGPGPLRYVASTGAASTGAASTGVASTGVASTGAASTGVASTGDGVIEQSPGDLRPGRS
jgi:ribonuclease-3